MNARTRIVVWAVAVGCGLVAVGLIVVAFVVDLETADQTASIAGALVGLAGLAVSVYALRRPGPATPGDPVAADAPVEAGGDRSVAAGGNIRRVVTGDNVSLTTPAATLPQTGAEPTGSPRPVRATGERSTAAGGDIDEAITGDGSRA
ncbi:hypothetical protein [Streptomyces anulatus]|uniref:hypothetical protein n=1 Tax=Streptomyces anulatus TaxID=1892 RepID=UPI003331C953